MNKKRSDKNIAVAVLSFILLTGFSGKQRFVELRGAMNGRSSSEFDADSNNKVALLDNRTRAEVLERKKLESGNYGLRIKPLNGPNKGKDVWVLYDMNEPEMRLFNDIPADWSKNSAKAGTPTNDVDAAVAAEMNRDVKGLTEDSADDKALISLFDRANAKISQVGRPAGNCPTCEAQAAQQAGLGEPVNDTPTDSGKPVAASGNYKPTTKVDWAETTKDDVYSSIIRKEIATNARSLLDLSPSNIKDITALCPGYSKLTSEDKKLDFWALMFSQISLYESGNRESSFMEETKMSRDRITKEPTYSEGLLQLSYQDKAHGKVCDFDWAGHDKFIRRSKKPNAKYINDPVRNLKCGVKIMADQIKNHHKLVMNSGQKGSYWAVILKGAKGSKLRTISAAMHRSPLCSR